MKEDFIIPSGWSSAPLKDVAQKIVDGSHNPPPKQETGFPMLSARNITWGSIEFSEFRYIAKDAFEAERKRADLQPGDVLLTIVGTIGRAVVIPKSAEQFSLQRSVAMIRPNGLDSKFCMFQLLSDRVQKWLRDSARGSAQQGVYLKTLGTLPMLVAPLPEQQRIVAEIEKQFTRLEAGVAALRRVQANLKRYRAAVLKAACEGRLVPTEAELAKTGNRKARFESGETLLARILIERRSKWEAEQLSKFEADGRMPENDKWRARYKEPEGPDISSLPELPEGWVWVELGQLAWSVKDGPHYSPKYAKEGVPFISGGNIRPSGVNFDNAKRITPELHAELSRRCKPEVGDILYTKGGTTGIARVNTYPEDFNVWVHVAVLKLVDSVRRFYIQHTLNSPFCYAQAQKFTHGVGNQDLGLTRLVHISLGLPPLTEQVRIVAEVERRLSVVEELEAMVSANLQRAVRFRQSILQRAFTGGLLKEDNKL